MEHGNSLAASALVILATAGMAAADGPLIVTNGNDSGDGSLRAALAAAETRDGPVQVLIMSENDITIQSALVYAGIAPLTLIGAGQTIITDVNADILAITNGADLTVSALNFAGPGGFDVENRGDLAGPAGKGIFVDLRDDQTGTVSVNLSDVIVARVAGHGIHVSDCTLADACGGGSGGAGDGSAASIAVTLNNVVVSDVGNGRFDADGLRVDERGAGDISLVSSGSSFDRVGADGIELDEGQDGDVRVVSRGDVFRDNGNYCDPAILAAFMPAMTEGEFADGAMTESGIPKPITGSPDDNCFERDVSLYVGGSVEEFEIALDLDDGFDIDEAGPGGINAVMIDGLITGNRDEGLDFDEEGQGDIVVSLWNTRAEGNTDDGLKFSEEDGGDVLATMMGVGAAGNGGKGVVFEEADDGDVMVEAMGVITHDNNDGDDTGVEVVQEDDGTGLLKINGSDIVDGVETDGVEVVAG